MVDARGGGRARPPAVPPLRRDRPGAAALALPEIAWRGGVDLNPLDVTDPEAMRWLETLVWPEEDDRRERLRQAIAVALTDPPRLVRGDLLEELPALVEEASAHGTVIVFHSAVAAYLPVEARASFQELMIGLVADGACHWVSNEAPNVLPDVTATGPAGCRRAPSFVLGLDGRMVARTHGHGHTCTGLTSTLVEPVHRGMHAIRLHAFGPPDHLVLDELPDLEPASGEVRIAVEASGVHLLDTTIRRGEKGPLPLPELPTVPGREVAGVVDALGPDVDATWLGRRVVAHLGPVPGGYAEQAVTAIEKLFRVRRPRRLPRRRRRRRHRAYGAGRGRARAADRPTTWCWCPRPPGGWAGCSCSRPARPVPRWSPRLAAERTAALEELGADLVVDYGRAGLGRARSEERLGGVTLVYDGVGGEIGGRRLELLRPGGRLVMFGFSAGTPTELTTADLLGRGISAGWSLGARMNALPGGIPGLAGRALDKVAAGEWRPLVSTYPLAEAARAHADLEGRRALGKVVLVTDRRTR